MGMSVSTVAFRRTPGLNWAEVCKELEAFWGTLGDVRSDLSDTRPGYGAMGVYGGMGAEMEAAAKQVSRITGDYAVAAECVDSDFAIVVLCRDGNVIEQSIIGDLYEEFAEFMSIDVPDISLWKPLLRDQAAMPELEEALLGNAVFIETQLEALSALTGMPVFDPAMPEEFETE